MRLKFILPVFLFLLSCNLYAGTLISEDFNDQQYSAPLSLVPVIDGQVVGLIYSTSTSYGPGAGASIEVDHSTGDVSASLQELGTYLDEGVYFRYRVFYPDTYYFPGDEAIFENVKMLKFAGAVNCDIEFIYKNTEGGPESLQLYWFKEDATCCGGTGSGAVSIPQKMNKGVWHKIEIYTLVAETSTVHVQIDDNDVYVNTDADIRFPASLYNVAGFISIRASNYPSPGHGIWYFDNITVVHNEGDLCDREPPEPGAVLADSEPPRAPSGLSAE